MQKHAIVTEVSGNIAVVSVSRRSACEGCSNRESCHACIALGGNRELRSKALNTVGAELGDRVVIETDSNVVIGYAAAVFLFPLALGILGYLLASLAGEGVIQYIGALVGFAAAFVFLYLVPNRRAERRCDVRIVRIIKGDSGLPDTDN